MQFHVSSSSYIEVCMYIMCTHWDYDQFMSRTKKVRRSSWRDRPKTFYPIIFWIHYEYCTGQTHTKDQYFLLIFQPPMYTYLTYLISDFRFFALDSFLFAVYYLENSGFVARYGVKINVWSVLSCRGLLIMKNMMILQSTWILKQFQNNMICLYLSKLWNIKKQLFDTKIYKTLPYYPVLNILQKTYSYVE